MTPLLSLILLVLIAYIGAVFLHKIRTRSLILKSVTNSGIIYLLLGFLLGPNVLKILDISVLNDLSLVEAFVLGWAGFIIGLQINVKQMLRFPKNYYWKTLLIFAISFLLLTILIFTISIFIYKKLILSEIVVLAVAGAVSSPLLIGLLKKEYKLKGKLIHYLQFHSAFDNMIGIVIIGIMIFLSIEIKKEFSLLLRNMMILFGGASVMAVLFYFTAQHIKTIPQYFLLIIGFILILVGTAIHIGHSVIFISFIFGVVLANLSINTWKLYQTISSTEKPIYLIMLILIGARLPLSGTFIALLIILYIIIRFIINFGVTTLIISRFEEFKPHLNIIRYAVVGMGGLSLAFGLDYYLLNSYSLGSDVLFILAISYIVNDTFSLKLLEKNINS